MLNIYGPFLGAGVRVRDVADNFRFARVEMPLTFYNRNYVGTHFGGSLYSMCDPMYMLLLLNALGNEYIVWDKAASIEYIKPAKTTVSADFVISDDLIEKLQSLQPDEKTVFDLSVDVKDTSGDVVARVVKTEYVKRKPIRSKL